MTLLSDFKTLIGVTGTGSDQFFVDYYINPALERAAVLATNYKETTVTLTAGTQDYDLTSSSIASPVVGSGGVQGIHFGGQLLPYEYMDEFYFPTPTTMYFVEGDRVRTGPFTFRYNAYYTKPTVTPSYIETDAPTNLFPALLKYSQALYRFAELTGGPTGGVERVREDNLERSYGSIETQKALIVDSMKVAEQMMMQFNGKNIFKSIQVI